MADFQKMDSDSVSSSDSSPLDSWALKTEAENIRAASEARPRRTSTAYPEDCRQTFSAAVPMALPLCVWPVGPRLSSLQVKLRGLCSASSSVAALKVRLCLQEASGRLHDTSADTTLTASSDVQTPTLSIDCRQVQGSVVVVWLVVQSLDIATVSTGAVVGFSGNGLTVDIGSTLQALIIAGRHYRLGFQENPSGSNPDDGGGYPGSVHMIYNSASSSWWVFPQASEYLRIAYSNWFAALIEIGRFTLYGWSLLESHEDLPDLRQALNSAKIPRALTLRSNYQRGFDLASERTSVIQASGSPDYSSALTKYRPIWPVLTYKESTSQIAGACLCSALPAIKINSEAVSYRRRYRAWVLLLALNNQFEEAEFEISFEVNLHSFGSGAWTTDSETPSLTGQTSIPVDPLPCYQSRTPEGESADLIWLVSPHHLQGLFSFGDLRRSTTGLSLAEFSFEEAAGSQTETDRLLTLGISASGLETSQGAIGAGTSIAGIKIGVPCWTVIQDRGF
ncbi:MAG: hypothetical protein CMJ75_22800 [Planctomycetaceae bacterium]|nr:hypothetical protein [Planctomycetaceae bacterium]